MSTAEKRSAQILGVLLNNIEAKDEVLLEELEKIGVTEVELTSINTAEDICGDNITRAINLFRKKS